MEVGFSRDACMCREKLVQWRLHFLTLLAQMHAACREPQEAMGHLTAAIDVAKQSQKHDVEVPFSALAF